MPFGAACRPFRLARRVRGAYAMVSTTTEIFASLFGVFLTLAIVVGAVVLGLLAYLIVRYRDRRDDRPEPEDAPKLGQLPPERGRARTILVSVGLSSIILTLLVVGTFGAMDRIETPPATDSLDIQVIGFQWAWKFRYPNGVEVTGELRVPAGQVVTLFVTSDDVFHSYGIPDFKIKADAIPGKVNRIWFVAKTPGEYASFCYELCGLGHAYMTAKLIVMDPVEFQNWYSTLGATGK